MGKCILTGDKVTESNDSRAHIIASALGGRLKPTGILSITGNNILDRRVDNPHIKTVQYYMTLLNGSRDRGGSPTLVRARDKYGKRYMIGADEIKPLDHEYTVTVVDGKPNVTIKATSMKQAKELVGKAKKELNLTDAQAKELLEKAQHIEVDPGVLSSEIIAGPAVEFPSAFTMAALFCAHHGLPVHSDFANYINSFDDNTQPRPMPPETFYFIHQESWFKIEAEVGHCLILYGDPIRKQAIFFSQLFNMLGIAVLMPFAGSEPVLHTYGVDILEGKDASVHVNTATLCGLDWKETHKLGEPELYAINQEKSSTLMQIASNRQFTRTSKAIWSKHTAGKNLNGPMSRTEKTALYKDFCELLKRKVKPEYRDEALRGLKQQFDLLGGFDE